MKGGTQPLDTGGVIDEHKYKHLIYGRSYSITQIFLPLIAPIAVPGEHLANGKAFCSIIDSVPKFKAIRSDPKSLPINHSTHHHSPQLC
jgi:hypothetical protein